jgi:hypothetical protein
MLLGVGSIESTSPTRSARHEVGTCVSDTRQTNRRTRVNQYNNNKRIVLHSNGEPVRAESSHRPGCSLRSTYATDDRWDDSRRPQSHSAAPEPLIRRLAAASLSPACQRRKTHLAARARARSIEFDRCAAATLETTRRRSRLAQMMAVRAHHDTTTTRSRTSNVTAINFEAALYSPKCL